MVQVPMSRDTSVRQEALPGVRVDTTEPLAAFGGGEALTRTQEAVRGINKDAMTFALQEKQNADDIRVQDADLQASIAQTDIQTKAKNMLGKDALNAPDYVEQEWKKRTDKIREGLSDENQKRAFDKIHAVRYADLYNFTQNHVSVEGKKYDGELTDAYLKNAQNVAATNYQDVAPGGQIEQSIFLQEQALRKYGDRNGIPKELLDNKIATTTSATHSAVIDQMLANKNDQLASNYYKEKKANILPEDRIKLEKAIEAGALLGEGQRAADEIFAKHSDNRNAAFDYVKNKIKDPELRKQTESQLESMFTRQSQAIRADNYKNYQLASQLVEQNQTPPANLTVGLTAEQNAALKRRQKQVNAGEQPNTDWTVYYNLKNMAADKKNDFMNENLLEYRHVLADQEFKDLTNLQGQLKKNDSTAQVQLNGFRTTTQVINDTMMSAGINVKSKRPEDQKKVSAFRRQVDEHVQILQEQTGKKARSEDVQKIADNLLITAINKRPGIMGIFDREKKVFEIQYKDVPTTDRTAIMRELKKRGRPITERAVLEYYLKGIEFRKGRDGY